MNKNIILLLMPLIALVGCSKKINSQHLNRKPKPATIYNTPKPSPAEQYIYKYSKLSMKKMRDYGIPASITLAQGILESASGISYLARKGNYHFGIKVNSEWDGQYIIRKDDQRKDRFRKYKCVEECFNDHSIFLKRARYTDLFKLKPTDYKGWALGLQAKGYATSKTYAQRLIAIIEKYKLYDYDKIAMGDFQVMRAKKASTK
ncbi:MAG: glycoside hydrolase family 73 protein [Solitalea-like symbiont of Acarus siro]